MGIIKSSTRAKALAVSLLSSALLIVVPGTAAHAQACEPSVDYVITSSSEYHIKGKGLPVFKDGKGGTVTGSVEVNTSVGASITAGAEADLGGVIAEAKVSVSATISKTVGITLGHQYSHDISSGKYGNMQYGSWGKSVSWKKQTYASNCSVKVLSSGTAKLPTTKVGWKYWETTS